jgi:hypothetical protein
MKDFARILGIGALVLIILGWSFVLPVLGILYIARLFA